MKSRRALLRLEAALQATGTRSIHRPALAWVGSIQTAGPNGSVSGDVGPAPELCVGREKMMRNACGHVRGLRACQLYERCRAAGAFEPHCSLKPQC